MKTLETEYYLGKIITVDDPDLYKITVDIPGFIKGALAVPGRGEIDEPKIGDIVLLRSIDPVYHSIFIYEKLKENSFIGFRSRGKMINITPEHITVGIFDPETEYTDDEIPEVTSWIKIDSSGNIDINAEGNQTIKITGDINKSIEGGITIEISGDCNLKCSGNTVVDSPKVQITGGQLTVNGSCSPTGSGGFCGIPVCPFTGAPHVGNTITGT